MFDEYLKPHRVEIPISHVPAVQVPVNSAGVPSSTTIDQDAPSLNNPVAPVSNNPFINVFAPEPSSDVSSSEDECCLDIHLIDGHVFTGGISDEDANSLDTSN
nr:hypothetical protein [Tanacetum cinerariifolium]